MTARGEKPGRARGGERLLAPRFVSTHSSIASRPSTDRRVRPVLGGNLMAAPGLAERHGCTCTRTRKTRPGGWLCRPPVPGMDAYCGPGSTGKSRPEPGVEGGGRDRRGIPKGNNPGAASLERLGEPID